MNTLEKLTEEKKAELIEALKGLDLFELKELLDRVEEARKELEIFSNNEGSEN